MCERIPMDGWKCFFSGWKNSFLPLLLVSLHINQRLLHSPSSCINICVKINLSHAGQQIILAKVLPKHLIPLPFFFFFLLVLTLWLLKMFLSSSQKCCFQMFSSGETPVGNFLPSPPLLPELTGTVNYLLSESWFVLLIFIWLSRLMTWQNCTIAKSNRIDGLKVNLKMDDWPCRKERRWL